MIGGITILLSPLMIALAMRSTLVWLIALIGLLTLSAIYLTSKFRITLTLDSIIIDKIFCGLSFSKIKFMFDDVLIEDNDINFVRGPDQLSLRFERKNNDTVEVEFDSKYRIIGNMKNSAEIMTTMKEEIRIIDKNAR